MSNPCNHPNLSIQQVFQDRHGHLTWREMHNRSPLVNQMLIGLGCSDCGRILDNNEMEAITARPVPWKDRILNFFLRVRFSMIDSVLITSTMLSLTRGNYLGALLCLIFGIVILPTLVYIASPKPRGNNGR